MYNLLVSGNPEAWQGEPWQIEFSRCVREYTDNAITERFGSLDDAAVSELSDCHRSSPMRLSTNRIQSSG